jgi:hypothetical protein
VGERKVRLQPLDDLHLELAQDGIGVDAAGVGGGVLVDRIRALRRCAGLGGGGPDASGDDTRREEASLGTVPRT